MLTRQHLLPSLTRIAVAWRVLIFLALCGAVRGASSQDDPSDFIVPTSTLSPDGQYGVTVPKLEADSADAKADPQNQLIDARTGRVLTTIHASTG